jgi:hypothetical protein
MPAGVAAGCLPETVLCTYGNPARQGVWLVVAAKWLRVKEINIWNYGEREGGRWEWMQGRFGNVRRVVPVRGGLGDPSLAFRVPLAGGGAAVSEGGGADSGWAGARASAAGDDAWGLIGIEGWRRPSGTE